MKEIKVDYTKRCPTGIPGLDDLMEGGLPRNRTILLAGTAGSGKTTLAVQFLVNGALKYDEAGILISLEQDPKELKEDMQRFGFDLQRLEYENKLIIVDASLAHIGLGNTTELLSSIASTQINHPEGSMSLMPDEFNIDKIIEVILSKTKKNKVKRVVFDSLPALDFLIENGDQSRVQHTIRRIMLALNYRLKDAGLTTVIITEQDELGKTPHGIESYVTDGAITMHYASLGTEAGRGLIIKKMRGTRHSEDIHPITIVEGVGIEVKKADEAFTV